MEEQMPFRIASQETCSVRVRRCPGRGQWLCSPWENGRGSLYDCRGLFLRQQSPNPCRFFRADFRPYCVINLGNTQSIPGG